METPLSPLEFARRARKVYRNREAVVDGALRLTYGELFARCDRWASALHTMGIGQGDRLGVIAPNTHGNLEQFYAVPQLGAVLVPMNYRLQPEDFVYLANHSGCRVLCVHADQLEAVDGVRDQMETVEHFVALEGGRAGWLNYEQLLAEATGDAPQPDISENNLIAINYTSGTTSNPKGVMITHRNAWTNTMGTLAHWHMEPANRYLWTLPMFHANGWTFTWTVTAVGAAHVCLRKVDPELIYRLCNDEDITHLCASPTVLIAIGNGPEQARRQVKKGIKLLTAGAPPAAATIERIEGELGWEITHVYGLTETAPFITICEPLAAHADMNSSERAEIKARQGVELVASGETTVFDENDHEVAWDGATLGEIVARGNVIMKGYYNDPDATAEAIRDGWYHTGDAAVIHPDGYIEIRDRFKDVIVSGGENISSIEVEGALLRHPDVLEVAVVGMPHDKWGESPHAFIVLKFGETGDAEAMRNFAREQLAHFKAPTGYHFVDELPKTATGKIQKYQLREGRTGITAQ